HPGRADEPDVAVALGYAAQRDLRARLSQDEMGAARDVVDPHGHVAPAYRIDGASARPVMCTCSGATNVVSRRQTCAPFWISNGVFAQKSRHGLFFADGIGFTTSFRPPSARARWIAAHTRLSSTRRPITRQLST